jgi:predicted nucleic acid-binding protein
VQEKVVFDTNVYIGVFNRGFHRNEVDGFNKVFYLVHPVLHELWMGAKGKREMRHLAQFGRAFIRSGRLVVPSSSTQVMIGQACQKLRAMGRLNPAHPHIYNDVSIALLARQIGATVVTENGSDFREIRKISDFKLREVFLP